MKNGENNKKLPLSARIMAGVLAGLMFASVVFGILYYIVDLH